MNRSRTLRAIVANPASCECHVIIEERNDEQGALSRDAFAALDWLG